MKFRRDDVLIAGGVLAIFVASFIVFWPALGGAFIWDDLLNIDRNPLIRSDTGLADIWTAQGDAYDYYPLTWTTWWLEWRAWGRNTVGYHVLNVILHASAAAMLWRVLVRLKLPGAFLAAFIFAVHPVNVESVAWITERKNTLSMLMLAVSLALYFDSRREDAPRLLYWTAVGFFGLSLLAKPSTVMLPVILLLLAWWSTGKITRKDLKASVPFFVLSATISLVTILIHHSRGIGNAVVRTDSFESRLAGAGWCVWFYLDKLIRPIDLAFVYPRWKIDPASPLHWLPLAALLAALGLLFALRNRIGRGPFVGLASFVAMLVPVLGLFNIYFYRYSYVSDHWQYHGSIIIFAFVAAVATSAFANRKQAVRIGGIVAACAVVGWLALQARAEAHHYVDEPNLWRNAVADNPNAAMPLNNYASTYLVPSGRLTEARTAFRRVIELDPGLTEAYLSMGTLAKNEGKLDKAIVWYRRALDTPFGGKDPAIELGTMYMEKGDLPAAIEWFEQSLLQVNDFRKFHEILPTLHERVGNIDRALDLFRMNTRLAPKEIEQWFVLGAALTRHGRIEEGNAAFATARKMADENHVELNAMGNRLNASGHHAAAEPMLREAVRVKPDYGPAYDNLGKSLEAQGKLEDAEAAFAKVVELQPNYLAGMENLTRIRAARSAPPR